MKEKPQLSSKFVFRRLGYHHHGNNNSPKGNTLPMRRHVIGQGKSPNERQVVKVNVKEGVAILKIIIMMQGDVKNSKT